METRWGRGSRRHPHTPGAGSRWGCSPGHHSRQVSRCSTWWWGCWSALRVPPQQPLLPGMCVPAAQPLFVLLILFALSCPSAGCPMKPVQQGQPAVSGVGVAVLELGRARARQGSCWPLGPTGSLRWANCLRSQGPSVPVLPVPGCPWWAPTLTCPGVSLQAVHGAGAYCSALPLNSPLGLLLWGYLGILPAGVGTWCWEGGESPGVMCPDSCLHGSVAPGEDRPDGHH